jgi:CRP/FNR family cyclic AMP-dependent transcriptional regulator
VNPPHAVRSRSRGVGVGETLRTASLLRCVGPSAVDELFAQFEVVDLARDQVLFEEGQPCDALYIILRGKIMLGRAAANGGPDPIRVMGKLDQFGEESLYDGRRQTATATAIIRSHVARLPQAALMRLARTEPQVARHLLESLARRLCDAEFRMIALATLSVRARVADQLLDLAQRFGPVGRGPVQVAHGLTQQELASLVGASRGSVNRVLADFSARGLITARLGRVAILDRASLAREAARTS